MELIFTLIIGMFICAEHRLYRTFLTPFSIIAIVYTVLILINNFIAVEMGFYGVSTRSILYIMYFLILIIFTSICFYFLMKKQTSSVKDNASKYLNNIVYRNKKTIMSLFLIGLIAKYISLFQAITFYGLPNIKGKAFGLFAHIGNIAVILMPYIMLLSFRSKNKIRYLILIILVYVNLFMFGGKYGVTVSFIHLIITYEMVQNTNTKKMFKLAAAAMFFGVLIFVIIYSIKPVIIQGYFNRAMFLDSMYFALRHFVFYLVSPLIATDYYFNYTNVNLIEGIQILFTVPINIIKAIFRTGEYVYPVNPDFTPVSNTYVTNVGGLFAESVYYTGFFVASIYVVFYFCIVYYFYNKSRYRGEMLSLTALMLAVVAMMFFCNFLTVSGVQLPIIYLWIVELFLKKKFVRKR